MSRALWLAVAMVVQASLGIITLLNQVPIDLGLSHQAMAIVVLTMALFHTERLGARLPATTPAKLSLVVDNPR
jgi:cytochrome c oxidase assembly protein subunit 15